MSPAEFDLLSGAMAAVLRDLVVPLAQRIAALEERPMPFYRGPWEAGQSYPKSASVRWGGALWLALKATVEKPGEGSPDWQLLVSRGKTGREGKRGAMGPPGPQGPPGPCRCAEATP